MTVLEPFPPMRIFTTIDEILTEVAAGDDVRRYFELRGLKTVGTLALVAANEDAFMRHVCDPLMNGFTSGTDRVQVTESEKPIVKAVLLHAWSLAKSSWAKSVASVPTHPGHAAVPTPPATGAGSGSSDHKVPKTLPAGEMVRVGGVIQQHHHQWTSSAVSGAGAARSREHHSQTMA